MFQPASYRTQSPVLFVIFNRPDVSARVFEQIRIAAPPRLYVAGDGPRADRPNDKQLCQETRDIINKVDWPCEVRTRFIDENSGCRKAVSTALNWFFEQEEEGIILEDDCLPANSFFRFCDELLHKYRNDTRIRHITGCNLQQGRRWGDASYYLSTMTHVWGWASWRRVWDDYKTLPQYDTPDVKKQLANIFPEPLLVDSWYEIFRNLLNGTLNSWGYQLDLVNFFNYGLTIIPNDNLISNIGFHPDATHTIDPESIYANIPVVEIGEITHPQIMLPQKQADMITLSRDFNIEAKKRKQNKWHRKLRRWSAEKLGVDLKTLRRASL